MQHDCYNQYRRSDLRASGSTSSNTHILESNDRSTRLSPCSIIPYSFQWKYPTEEIRATGRLIVPLLFAKVDASLLVEPVHQAFPFHELQSPLRLCKRRRNTNTGTDEAHPWLHAPGMPNCANTCASVQSTIDTTTANVIVFICIRVPPAIAGRLRTRAARGHSMRAARPQPAPAILRQAAACTMASDQTWYNSGVCGLSWCRPVLSGDNPTTREFGTSQFASSCAYQVTGGSNTLTTTGGNRTQVSSSMALR